MFRAFVLATLVSLSTPAFSSTVSFDGFGGLFFFDGGSVVPIEGPVRGNLDTGQGSAFFELITSGPRGTQTVDGFGNTLATPRECFGNNQTSAGRGGLLPCFVTDTQFETTYSLVVEGPEATLEVFAANTPDPMAFLLGQTETRFARSTVQPVPLPDSILLLLGALGGLGLVAHRRRRKALSSTRPEPPAFSRRRAGAGLAKSATTSG